MMSTLEANAADWKQLGQIVGALKGEEDLNIRIGEHLIRAKVKNVEFIPAEKSQIVTQEIAE